MDKIELEKIINWVKNYVEKCADGVVIGMSGGKDSLVTAKICTEALGKDKVLGVIMPNGEMKDNAIAKKSCEILGVRYYEININNLYNIIINNTQTILNIENKNLSTVTTFNVPPRLRMITLYAIAGSMNYLVANTSNLSEGMVGYTTKWGDNVGDFSVLADFTKDEVCQLGSLLGLPKELVYKIPDDGLTGKTDEEKLGFSYQELDDFIRSGIKSDKFEIISNMHKSSCHKRSGVVKYNYQAKNFFNDDNI